jgi:hypothetical protein
MMSALAARLSRTLVVCYPRRWRQRYGEEMLDVLDQHRPTARTVLNLAAGAVSTHLDPAYRRERPARTGLDAGEKVAIATIAATSTAALTRRSPRSRSTVRHPVAGK